MTEKEKEQIRKEIGKRLEEILKSMNIKKSEFANMIGVSFSEVSHILAGRRPLNIYHLTKLNQILNDKLDVNYLLFGGEISYVAENLRLVREHFNISSEELSQLLEINEEEYRKIEKKDLKVNREFLNKVSILFCVDPLWISGLKKEKIYKINFDISHHNVSKLKKRFYSYLKEKNLSILEKSKKASKIFITDHFRIALFLGFDYSVKEKNLTGGIVFLDEKSYSLKISKEPLKLGAVKEFFIEADADVFLVEEDVFEKLEKGDLFIDEIESVQKIDKEILLDVLNKKKSIPQKTEESKKFWEFIDYIKDYEYDDIPFVFL